MMLRMFAGALALAGVLVLAGGALADDNKDAKKDTKKDQPPPAKKDANPEAKPDLPKRPTLPPGFDREQLKEFRQAMEQYRKQMEEAQKEMRKAMEESQRELRKAMEDLKRQLPGRFGGNFQPGQFGGGLGGRFGREETRLGARVAKPNETLTEQLNLPEGKGLVLEQVRPEGAAGKAGLKNHDILLELDGKAVPSEVSDFNKMLADIKADAKVEAKVLRKGKQETIKDLTLPEARGNRLPGLRQPQQQPRNKNKKNITGILLEQLMQDSDRGVEAFLRSAGAYGCQELADRLGAGRRD